MSIAKKISLSLAAATLAIGALASSNPASAGGLSKQEAALLAGAGGFFLGAIVGSHSHHGHHGRVIYVNSWEAHVNRCYARYNTYNEHSDTYISYAGYEKRCRL
jgi:hypothetical protein